MPRTALSLLLMLLGVQAQAAEIRDYAYQAAIDASDENLQRIELPLEVILNLTSPALGDLAVFNADGKPMLHTVTVKPAAVSDRILELPFHKFDRFLRQQTKTVTTREHNQQANSSSELETTETVAVPAVRNDYLIELAPGETKRAFERLELQWRHEPSSQILEVRVEAGNELDHLRTINPRKSLTNNQSDDEGWRSITRIPKNYRYLRLTPVNDVTSFELQRVIGHFSETGAAPKLSHTITPERVSDDGETFYSFLYPSVVRPQSMRIIPGGEHSIIVGDLYVSSSSEPDKRRLARRNFRQHNISDEQIRPSKPIDMAGLYPARLWFSSSTELAVSPRIELDYAQYEVVFLADGKKPYRLAWGNHAAQQAANADLIDMLQENIRETQKRGELVRLGATEDAGGMERLSPQAALPWKKWLLWALLVLAALITGRMALRLYHEMNSGTPV